MRWKSYWAKMLSLLFLTCCHQVPLKTLLSRGNLINSHDTFPVCIQTSVKKKKQSFGQFINKRNLFPTLLEAEKFQVKTLTDSVHGEDHFLVH